MAAFYVGDPPGTIKQFAGSVAPIGWLVCDGTTVSRTTYPDLFSTIGTAYGNGDGVSTFGLPDLRGRIPVGQGSHSDVGTLGNNEGSSLSARRVKHKHTVVSDNGQTFLQSPDNPQGVDDGTVAGGGIGIWLPAPARKQQVGPQTGNEPTDGPAYLVVRFIIKH